MDLILILAEHGYPPVPQDEVFKELFEQAENFKKYEADDEMRPTAVEVPLEMTIESEPEDTICWMAAEPSVRDDDD